MKRKKLTKAEREERDAFHERVLANAQRTRELAEKAQAELDAKQSRGWFHPESRAPRVLAPLTHGARLVFSLRRTAAKRGEVNSKSSSRAARTALVCLLFGLTTGRSAGCCESADDYIALGDSFSSGVGTNSYTLSASCRRGVYAYPWLVAQQRPNTSLDLRRLLGREDDRRDGEPDPVRDRRHGDRHDHDRGQRHRVLQPDRAVHAQRLLERARQHTRVAHQRSWAHASTRCTRRSEAAR